MFFICKTKGRGVLVLAPAVKNHMKYKAHPLSDSLPLQLLGRDLGESLVWQWQRPSLTWGL